MGVIPSWRSRGSLNGPLGGVVQMRALILIEALIGLVVEGLERAGCQNKSYQMLNLHSAGEVQWLRFKMW